ARRGVPASESRERELFVVPSRSSWCPHPCPLPREREPLIVPTPCSSVGEGLVPSRPWRTLTPALSHGRGGHGAGRGGSGDLPPAEPQGPEGAAASAVAIARH